VSAALKRGYPGIIAAQEQEIVLVVRIRRTAEASRELILTTAARRFRQHGLEGLNIPGVSDDADISHATLIHHFGSSAGMRDALADHMTAELIRGMLAALNEQDMAEFPAWMTKRLSQRLYQKED